MAVSYKGHMETKGEHMQTQIEGSDMSRVSLLVVLLALVAIGGVVATALWMLRV